MKEGKESQETICNNTDISIAHQFFCGRIIKTNKKTIELTIILKLIGEWEPDAILTNLLLKPYQILVKGEIHPIRRNIINDQSVIKIDIPIDDDFDTHNVFILVERFVRDNMDVLKAVHNEFNVKMIIDIGFDSEFNDPDIKVSSFIIPYRLMDYMSQCKIDMELSEYYLNNGVQKGNGEYKANSTYCSKGMKLNKMTESTLESLLGKRIFPMKKSDGSYLVVTCNNLHKKALDQYEVEDIRIMIGQNIGLKYLIPKAIEKLEQNILAEGDFYEGDLLKSVLLSNKEYWEIEKKQWKQITNIFISQKELIENFDTTNMIRRDLFNAFAEFESINKL